MTFNPVVLVDALISIAGTSVSDHGNKIELPVKVEDLDATTFGQTWHVRRGGLKDGSVNITFLNDFDPGNLDAIFWPLLGTVVTFDVRPVSSVAVSTSNPKFTGSILIAEWKPLSGKIGELNSVDVSFPTSGAVTRGTS